MSKKIFSILFNKLFMIVLIAIVFLYFLNFKWINNFDINLGLVPLFFVFSIIRNKVKLFFNQTKIVSVLIFFMYITYFIFGLFSLEIGKSLNFVFLTKVIEPSSWTIYWNLYGLSRVLGIFNTFIFLNLLISEIKIEDIFSLPLDINKLKYLILGKSLFNSAKDSVEKIDFFIDMFPCYQLEQKKLSFKEKFNKKLLTVLGLVFFVLRETIIQGEMIDNRIENCHNKQSNNN